MTQEGIIKCIIEAVSLDLHLSNAKGTPAKRKPLVNDNNGEPQQDTLNYASVAGMLLYLLGHSRPNIAYSVRKVAWFLLSSVASTPMRMQSRGLDITFLGPKTRAWFSSPLPILTLMHILMLTLLVSTAMKIITTQFVEEVALYLLLLFLTVLSFDLLSCRLKRLCQQWKQRLLILQAFAGSYFLSWIWSPKLLLPLECQLLTLQECILKDNSGALVFETTISPQYTPWSKYHAIKTIWFWEKIIERGIKVLAIETCLQMGDLFTKMPPQVTFEILQKLQLGW